MVELDQGIVEQGLRGTGVMCLFCLVRILFPDLIEGNYKFSIHPPTKKARDDYVCVFVS